MKNRRLNSYESQEIKLEEWIKMLGWICFIFVLAGFVAGVYGYIRIDMSNERGIESFGNYASGTVAAFWSLAGIVLIFIAFLGQKLELLYQKEDLKLTRKEFEEARKVMNDQKKEFELQNINLAKQNFENLFFQMLGNYTDIVHHIDIGSKPNVISGRDSFSEFYNLFKSGYGEFISMEREEEKINFAYEKFITNYQSDLGNYFRNLYHIFKFVHNSSIEDKKLYTSLIRAQLSTYELLLLFYNCLSSYGRTKFKPLVEEYNLIKNLPKSLLLKPEHITLYSKVMFEEDERNNP